MNKITSKIFIDGGDPEETRQANALMLTKLGRPLDGQTTNPTLIARNLKEQITKNLPRRQAGKKQKKLNEEDALNEYKRIVQEMSKIIPQGSISIQVFANNETTASEMLEQANDRKNWIPNASIKFPCLREGLKAANIACRDMPINITLVFSQEQGAAVHQATLERSYPIFISPFVGRLDDKGENGMDVVRNIKEMYKNNKSHVEVLTASTRSIEHIKYALFLKSEIITIPFKVFKLWADDGFSVPGEEYMYEPPNLKPIPYQELTLDKPWNAYYLSHPLTDAGIEAFYKDWTGLFN